MTETILKPRGDYWNNLTNSQVQEIRQQIPGIENDPNYTQYRFYKTSFHKWIICNIWTVPMSSKRSIWNRG